ncbi:MAG TPA: acetate--CoA ligase [Terriglobales bacterium]|jgi:acetyl-CoA synthetase|nr:acetate--CoA ligase [Terriglobales bacterium]
MSSPATVTEGISNLLTIDEEYPSPQIVAQNCRQQNFAEAYQRSVKDPGGFWGEYAKRFVWTRPWTKVLEWDGVHHQWFVGGKTNITLNALDRHAHSERRNRAAFIWLGEDGTERIVTYGQLHRMVCRFANGLKSLGVKKGDRVVIYMPLTIEGAVAMLACARVGAIHSVVYAGLGHTALRDRIVDAQAKVIIVGDVGFRRGKTVELKAIVDEAIDTLEFVEKVVVYARRPTELTSKREIDFNDLLKFPAECPAEEMDAEDPLFLLYTSGSTGKPKGVVHVHGGYMVATTYYLESFYDVGDQDIFWCTSDIGWVVGHSYIVYSPLCAGATTLFREGAIDYPNPGIAWEIVERYGVTKMFTAPTALRMFMRYGEAYPAKHDLTSLRVIACAGEPLNPEAWRWAQTYLAGDGKWGYVIDNWWQTELGGPALGTPPTMAVRPGKVGVALEGSQADVVDEQGKSVPSGVGGRLVLRRPYPCMLRTVWGDPARYERDWKQIPGCYVTGDVALRDKDGYITVLGRCDDVLNVAGHRIGTAEVESALVSHPAVAEAAAIGIPDPLKGEVIKCFVQTRAGHTPSDALANILIEHVRRELGPIATPAALEFVAALPKTRSGKILRRFLKAKEAGVDAGDVSTMEG